MINRLTVFKCDGDSHSGPTRSAKREQDVQFTDTIFEDSSPTELKTVHRHICSMTIDLWLENMKYFMKNYINNLIKLVVNDYWM